MNKQLIIVESPTKARVIKRFLGKDYEVASSMGHVRDLPTYRFGVDIENRFEPQYEIIKGKEKIINEIKRAAEEASKVYLAMDEDREGEAIGWHLLYAIDFSLNDEKVDRIAFHEVTEEAVNEALLSPRKINLNLVDAQQARRILDRIVGYKISPLLSKKIRKGLSAGRVQSVGLEIIVEREKERQAFKPQKYFTVEGTVDINGSDIEAFLWGKEGKKYNKLEINTAETAADIVNICKSEKATVTGITEKEKKNNPFPPFITSTLQQEAYNRLKFNPEKTMRVAQQLYEGIELKDGSSTGLITYMRTDSVKIAKSAVEKTRKYIKEKIGGDYLPPKPKSYKSRKSAQEAHECIRPTDVVRTPDSVEDSLSRDQSRLYKLVWDRFVSCQMKPAVMEQMSIDLKCADYDFRITGQRIKFDGYTRVWPVSIKENEMPEVQKGASFNWKELNSSEHETKPPARFTPATLVNELEKNGIGRPSTYATIINTLFKRKYVVTEQGSLVPQEIGIIVVEELKKHFPSIMDKKFTALMENNLDEVAEGKINWKKMIGGFYEKFKKHLEEAAENMEKIKDEETDKKCPECGAAMVIRWGRNGRFMACSAYPECKKTFNIDENGQMVKDRKTDMKCPKCGTEMIIKTGRYGKFLACSAYPECRTTVAIDDEGNVIHIPLGYEKCPDCGKETVIKVGPRGKFLACTGYPKCRFSMNMEKKKKQDSESD